MLKRRIDTIGRFRIPSKFYEKLKLSQDQQMEITLEYGEICIKKFQQSDIEKRQFVGIVRKFDALHRVSIPSEYLKLMGLKQGKNITVRIEEETIKFH